MNLLSVLAIVSFSSLTVAAGPVSRLVTPQSMLTQEEFGTGLTPQKTSILKRITAWNPLDRNYRFPEGECSPHLFTRALREIPFNAHSERAQRLQGILEDCRKTPSFLSNNRLLSSLKSNEVDIDLADIPGVKQYQGSSPNLEKTRFLSLLRDGKKPAVLIVCGTGCNLLNGPGRSLFAWIHASLDAHVFLLGSGSGVDSIRDNNRFLLGGAEEGSNVYHLLRLINASKEFSGRISAWHVLGISLGGHSALYSGIYYSNNSWNPKWPRLQSIVGYCPVVNLKPTLLSLDNTKFAGRWFRGFLSFIFQSYGNRVGIADLLPESVFRDGVQPGQVEMLIDAILMRRYLDGVRPAHLFSPPFDRTKILSMKDFWDLNNYLEQLKLNQVPTTIISAESDFVVNPKVNQIALEEQLAKSPHKPLSLIRLQKGGHCGQAISYSWELIANTLAELMTSQDPSAMGGPFETLPLEKPLTMDFDGYRWEVSKKGEVSLVLLKESPGARMASYYCTDFAPGVRLESCFTPTRIQLPPELARNLTTLLFESVPPMNSTTRALLVRILNARFGVLYPNLQEIGASKSKETTKFLRWIPLRGPR